MNTSGIIYETLEILKCIIIILEDMSSLVSIFIKAFTKNAPLFSMYIHPRIKRRV